MALELAGDVRIETCGSGHDALEVALSFRPDLILLDAMMPDLDGAATLNALRQEPSLGTIPVVFLTAKSSHAEIESLRRLGAADVIVKPFDPLTLGARVKEIWTRSHPF